MKIFHIPLNYEQPGHVLNGMIPFRNFIDGLVLGIIGFFISSIFAPDNFWDAISWYILICGLLFMLGVIGIQGTPLSVYLFDFIRWTQRRTPYFYNHHGTAYSSSAADVMLEAPQLRDHIASLVETVTEKLARKEVEYVEGETFQFAEDPELARLKNAEEEQEQEQETPAEEAPSADQASAEEQTATTSDLDFNGIIDNLSLPESED